MARILIVEDDASFATWVAVALSADGHEVATALKGEDAIRKCIRSQPDLLLVDIMLRDGAGGLRIVEAIEAMGFSPAILVMSGTLSADLDPDSRDLDIAGFLHKPFEPEQLSAAVDAALKRPKQASHARPALGVVELDQAGKVLYANERARQLFERTAAGRTPECLCKVFKEGMPDLHAAESRWVAAWPVGRSHVNWHLRTHALREDGTRTVVILLPDDPHFRHQHLVETILGLRHKSPTSPLNGQIVLVLDSNPVFRRTSKRELSSARVDSYSAASCDQAAHILQQDASISVLLLDLDDPGHDVQQFLQQCRAGRPGLKIIGMASSNSDDCGKRLGIVATLPKPWTMSNLLDVL